MVPMFLRGLHALGLDTDTIPSLDEVNAKLMFLTGWRGVYVKGLEDAARLLPAAARPEVPHRQLRA